jgi:methyl-accepting chemotaxis protein
MKNIQNLNLRGKLFVAFGLIIALIAWVIMTSYSAINTMRETQERMYNEDISNIRDLALLRADQNLLRAMMLEALILKNHAEQELLVTQASEKSKEVDRIIARLILRANANPTQLSRLDELKTTWQEFAQTKDTEIIPLIRAGKVAAAQRIAVGVQQAREARIRSIAAELDNMIEANDKQVLANATTQANQSYRIFLYIVVASVLISLALGYFTELEIVRPLRDLSRAAERITSGDLTIDISKDNRTDEVGGLIRAFSTMVESQRRVAREMREGSSVLAASAGEILATTTQVASGAAETASAVTETTATVEEVKQTAALSSQKAKYVSESAQKVAQVSQTGRNSVEGAIQGMQRIQEQMESIAESIVHLSEQGQTIGEIIATVNDLAEQSNLLAVNAAIEAAKAGEHGKGFGVVAQEVKSLAEQSKQATAQVRTILGEIQKATSAAVLATEQGSKAVEAGVKQSMEAGEAIRQLADSVQDSAQAAVQIAASSQQQMVGMDQVALAMGNIKQASMQNVAGTKQAEAAAQNLHELGQKLEKLVAQYKV